jgi:hypothetical protein
MMGIIGISGLLLLAIIGVGGLFAFGVLGRADNNANTTNKDIVVFSERFKRAKSCFGK